MILNILILILSTARLSIFFASEEGAWKIGKRVRDLFGVENYQTIVELERAKIFDGVVLPEKVYKKVIRPLPSELQPTLLSRGITCHFCNSFWIGGTLLISYLLLGEPFLYLISPLALSMSAIMAVKLT